MNETLNPLNHVTHHKDALTRMKFKALSHLESIAPIRRISLQTVAHKIDKHLRKVAFQALVYYEQA